MTDRPSSVSLGRLPDILIDAVQSGSALNRCGARVPLHSNISLDEAMTLYRLVRERKPAVSVETGFAQGISTLAILQAHADNGLHGVHHVIDPFQAKYEDCGLAMVEAAGLEPWMQFHRRFAEDVVPGLPRMQWAFIDSSHLFDLTIAEFVLIDKKLDVGGVIGFHDMWMPALQKVLRYIVNNRSYELSTEGSPPIPAAGWRARARLKSMLVRLAGQIPAGKRVLTEEALRPWSTLGVPNLAIVRKTADDARDWQFHSTF